LNKFFHIFKRFHNSLSKKIKYYHKNFTKIIVEKNQIIPKNTYNLLQKILITNITKNNTLSERHFLHTEYNNINNIYSNDRNIRGGINCNTIFQIK
jgi:hypothetical protein